MFTQTDIPLNSGYNIKNQQMPCALVYSVKDVSDYSNGIVNTQIKATVNSGVLSFDFNNDSDQIGVTFMDSDGTLYAGVNKTGYSFAPKDIYDVQSNTANFWIAYIKLNPKSGLRYSFRSSTRTKFSYSQAIIIGIGNNPYDTNTVRIVVEPEEEVGFQSFKPRNSFNLLCTSSDLLYDVAFYPWRQTFDSYKSKIMKYKSSESSTENLIRNLLLFFAALAASVGGIAVVALIFYEIKNKK